MLRIVFVLSALLLMAGCNEAPQERKFDAPEVETVTESVSGEMLFKRNCAQCHLPNKDFMGPALAGVEARWKSKELLYKFIRNSEEVIKTDAYAKELFIKWKELPMLPYPQLTDEEIDAILVYSNQPVVSK